MIFYVVDILGAEILAHELISVIQRYFIDRQKRRYVGGLGVEVENEMAWVK